jgi:hypothetical protein
MKAKIGRNSFAWERNGNKSVINEKFMVNLWKFMSAKEANKPFKTSFCPYFW